MRYVFDNNLSYRYAEMLAALGVDVVAVRHEFDESIKDVPLLEELSGREIVFVSGDTSIRTRPAEIQALREAKITALFLGPFWGKMRLWDQAVWIIRRWPTIDGFAAGVEKGTCAEIKQNGKAQIFQL